MAEQYRYKCAWCGKTYITDDETQAYCSKKCEVSAENNYVDEVRAQYKYGRETEREKAREKRQKKEKAKGCFTLIVIAIIVLIVIANM